MPSFKLTRTINAPPSAVFALFSDFAHAADRIKGITKLEVLTPGPVGVGTRFKETRVMFGREHSEEMEISAFDPGKSYEVTSISCGCEFRCAFRFTPDGPGTRVDVDFRTRTLTLWAKLMKPVAVLMIGPMKKCITSDVDDLKKVAEGTLVA